MSPRPRSIASLFLFLVASLPGCRFDDKTPSPAASPGSSLPPGGRTGGTASFPINSRTFVDPSLPGTTAADFPAAGGGGTAPRLVYPLANSMHPINLGDVTFQWSQGKGSQTRFHLTFTGASDHYDFYVPCTRSECIYQMPSGAWLSMASEQRGQTVTVTITGSDGKTASPASDPVAITFSPEPVKGALYYWSTKLKGVYRLNFGSQKALPYITPRSATNPDQCAGCHSVSRNGKVIAFTAVPADEGAFGGLSVAPTDAPSSRTIAPKASVTDCSVPALSPDGSRVAVVLDATYTPTGAKTFSVRDTATGQELKRITTGDPLLGPGRFVTFPEWSPDGQTLAVVIGSTTGDRTNYGATSLLTGDIALIPYNDGQLGPAQVLVAATSGEYHVYPSWSPDGKWLVFSTIRKGGNADNDKSAANPTARLRLVEVASGKTYELGAATQGSDSTATWPKFTPFTQSNGQLLFVSFSTKIDYGFVLKQAGLKDGQIPAGTPSGWKHPQIWMSAVDLSKLPTGQDPSSAPIWLPYQETNQDNHIPYWSEGVGCNQTNIDDAGCGADEYCNDKGFCVPIVQ